MRSSMGVSSRWRLPSWQDSGRMTSTWRTGLRTPCACTRSRAAEMPSAVAGDRPGGHDARRCALRRPGGADKETGATGLEAATSGVTGRSWRFLAERG
jgi:hypothetical protein